MKLNGKQIQFNKETAFRLLECKEDNPMYSELEILYDELVKDLYGNVDPKGQLDFAKAEDLFGEEEYSENAQLAMILYTLGETISTYCSKLFEDGEYLKGMLADAMADSCLFSMEKEWSAALLEECKKRNLGIARRMEAPKDFPVEVQKRIWQLLDGESMGVTMTSGYMFSPVKTICLLFELTDDVSRKNVEHDCNRCSNKECKLRNIKDRVSPGI